MPFSKTLRADNGEDRNAASAPRWDANGPVAELLRQMMANGDIPQSASPKTIWEMMPEFKTYPLDKFRSGLNTMKQKTGFHLRGNSVKATHDEENEQPEIMARDGGPTSSKKPKTDPNQGEDDAAAEPYWESNTGGWYKFTYVTAEKRMVQVLVLIMRGGVAPNSLDQVDYEVSECGTFFVVNATLPALYSDKELIAKSFSFEERQDHNWQRRQMAHESFFMSISCSNNVKLNETTTIPLDFEVCKKVEADDVHFMADPHGTRILIIDLYKAEDSNYVSKKPTKLNMVA